MGILDKVKSKINTNASSLSQSIASSTGPQARTQALGPALIPRYRKQRGLNLGSWFVLEKWITPSPFRNAASPGESDLDIAKGKDAKAILEEHWDNWIGEEDWKWIKDKGYNSVRIPVGCPISPFLFEPRGQHVLRYLFSDTGHEFMTGRLLPPLRGLS
jgi:glucan 1,3-beta-glucosidase